MSRGGRRQPRRGRGGRVGEGGGGVAMAGRGRGMTVPAWKAALGGPAAEGGGEQQLQLQPQAQPQTMSRIGSKGAPIPSFGAVIKPICALAGPPAPARCTVAGPGVASGTAGTSSGRTVFAASACESGRS